MSTGRDVPDGPELRERLMGEGLSGGAASDAARRLTRTAQELGAGDPRAGPPGVGPPGAGFFVPGRVEVLGKHTDYAGGRSLIAALEAGISVVVHATDEPGVHLMDTDTRRRARFDEQWGTGTRFGSKGAPEDGAPESETSDGAADDRASGSEAPDGWTRYPATYLKRIRADLPTLGVGMDGGIRVAWSSSLPRAAGMSSSSALLVALHLAFASRYRWAESERYRELLPDREALSGYLAAVEGGRPFGPLTGGAGVRGVGTDGGSQDHTAILCARPGSLVTYSFRPVRFEGAVPLPDGWTFALASSGVSAPKTGAVRDRYNRLARQAGAIAEAFGRPDVPHLGAILAQGPDALLRLGGRLQGADHGDFSPDELLARAAQFMDETGRHVPDAARALGDGDLERFGRAVESSHAAAVAALQNDTPETEWLTREARGLGASAASPFGAGFGGAVWALVRTEQSAKFLDRWRTGYHRAFPDRAPESAFLRSRAGPPALRVF